MAETRTELTAVAVEVEEGAALPANGLLAGWLEAKGELLEVAAVENGGTDLVFVTEGRALAELRPAYRTWDRWPRPYEFARDSTSEGLRFRFIRPVCRISAQAEMVANVFPATDWLTRTVGRPTSFGRIASLNHRAVWKGQNQRIADAVVVAVLAAAEGNRKRAVVLLLGSDAKDGSLRTPDEAMRFARRLCVPLLVLSAGNRHGPEAKRWGAEGLIRTNWELDVAVSHLLEEADRQRVFWVEGAHLPQDVGLGPLAKGIRLAR